MTIELEAKFIRGRGSVDEYLEQTAIANPHVTLHYKDPDGNETRLPARRPTQLPPEPKEIKPHPYGVELGRLVTMLKDTQAGTISQFLTRVFSRVSSGVARKICEDGQDLSTRADPQRDRPAGGRRALPGDPEHARSPAGDRLHLARSARSCMLKGLHQVVPGEFYGAATRPPAVYRGNPFLIEVGLAYGGAAATQKVTHGAAARAARAKPTPARCGSS